ncbi:class I SAM-dependent methyltransferase [Chelatococcus asaccharovorans]|uniref:class I SAM-dependent methyltransferase n=1 Tax=Chelatococcus asaccharovorans TaxID=28210 RepID=UPI00224C64FF|nr:class I SAM-dependent methyltransferase [Chelatococcus asaccharovorans]CAH1665096.1 Methyltransferase family protein [Chelatococcus asaccharovorans]CAH1682126.1 Methyltransferase family protein [Chelatococcus asaccharovorans]
MSQGWTESAAAWIADMGEHGDFTRQCVTDRPVLQRIEGRGHRKALDVGCGEGRFCRMLQERGISAIGLDPTEAMLAEARRRDPAGDYRQGYAEALPFADGTFDLVVSYLSLIDITDATAAIREMARVLEPGGSLIIVNLNGFATAGHWDDPPAKTRFVIRDYLDDRAEWVAWRGIRIRNWHRPLSRYMKALIEAGLILRHFDEPDATSGPADRRARYHSMPYCHIMEWEKPAERAA